LASDAEEVLRTLTPRERTVQHQDGRWYLVRVVPYRTVENLIDGVVLTFVDITEQKKAQMLGENIQACMHGIVDTVKQPMMVLDAALRVLSANSIFAETFGVTKEETEGKLIYDLGDGRWNIPELKKLLEDVLTRDKSFRDYPLEYDSPGSGRKKLLLNASRIVQEGVKTETILLAIEDVTGRQ